MKIFLQSNRFIVFSFLLLVSFALWSKYVDREQIKQFDFAVTVKIQDRVASVVGSRFDGLFEDVGFLASPFISTLIVLALSFLLFMKKKSMKAKIAVILIPIAFFLMTAAEIYGKSVVHHPAPPYFMLKNPTTVFPTYHVWEQFSYPSGHAARATFIAVILFLTTRKLYYQAFLKKKVWILLALVLYVSFVSINRIYLGHHWFSDIVGGVNLGVAFALLPLSVV